MKWVKQFGGYVQEWVLDAGDLPIFAHVNQNDDGDYLAVYTGGSASYPATDSIDFILQDVVKSLSRILAHMAQDVQKAYSTGVPVEQEPSPVELIPDSQGTAGYGDGWLRVRSGRAVPKHYEDTIVLDDGRMAHIHPFFRLEEQHLAGQRADFCGLKTFAELGLREGEYIAGVRWFSRAT